MKKSPPASTNALRAIIYVRLSSFTGAEDPSTSPQRQREQCEAYCLAKGWRIAETITSGDHPGVIEDLDVSGSDKGKRLDRPGLRVIRRHWGEFDVIVFAKLDRLARNVIDFRTFADEAADNGAALVSVAESLDLTTPSGRFVATILAAFAEMEAAVIATRTAEGVRGARALGRWPGGTPPYGMKIVPNPNGPGYILAPDDQEAPVIRDAAAAVLSGKALYSTALDMTRRDVPTRGHGKASGRWSVATLSKILTNPAIAGYTYSGNADGDLLRDPDTGLPRRVWEPIVTDDTYRALRALVPSVHNAPAARSTTATRPRRTRAARVLSGRALCGHCLRPLYVTSRSRTDSGAVIYTCSARRNGYDCPGTSINADHLDAFVTEQFLTAFGHHPYVEEIPVAVDDGRRADLEQARADTGRFRRS